MRKHVGFTLTEVMVVVAIIAVLAAIAYPSYGDYVRRGKIAEALSTLGETRAKMEQYFLDNRSYVGADAAANLPCDPTTLNAGKKHFDFTCTGLALGAYQVNAAGKATDGMGNFAYTINQANTRTSTISEPGWTGSTTCWVTKKGGTC
jgi:type IV pilus assembly protein PilE